MPSFSPDPFTYLQRRALGRIGGGVGGAVAVAATFDPANKSADITLSNGNRTATKNDASTGLRALVRSLSSKSAGKWHVEFSMDNVVGSEFAIGLAQAGVSMSGGSLDAASAAAYRSGGSISANGSNVATGDAYTTGDVIALEWDADARNFYVQKMGNTRQGPFALPAAAYFFAWQGNAGNTGQALTVNAGQSAFAITPTTGFLAWSA